MPNGSLTPCSYPGCAALVRYGKCDVHKSAQGRQAKRVAVMRGTSYAHLYNSVWAKARADYLRRHPLCVHCLRDGQRATEATQVDHVRPHRGDLQLFWDERNWQPLCASCHSTKTALEDGGFGTVRK